MTAQNNDVLFSELKGVNGDVGIITLNRPQVLNSLNHYMITAMYAQLKIWAIAKNIKAVIIQAAEGRAFCAGGDLRSTHERRHSGDETLVRFFYDEYQLNRFIFHFPKPYVALLDGITMGGGVGISIHGSHRIATERLLFAMPETGIGFFPDVGGTYFLPRLPNKMGFYLGLTGARISSDDCIALGLTQQKVASESLPMLIQSIADASLGDDAKQTVSDVISQFKQSVQSSALMEKKNIVEKCFSAGSMEAIHDKLQESSESLSKEALAQLSKKSPTSLKVTLLALMNGAKLDFDACMQQEFRLVSHFLQGHDFSEGIRAVIIDKDQQPKWKPALLADVTDTEVKQYFAPVKHELV